MSTSNPTRLADALEALRKRLAAAPEEVRCKVELRHGSLTEASEGLTGFDAAILVETIEHIEPDKLSLVERAVFRDMRPACAIITTPNSDFNALLLGQGDSEGGASATMGSATAAAAAGVAGPGPGAAWAPPRAGRSVRRASVRMRLDGREATHEPRRRQ